MSTRKVHGALGLNSLVKVFTVVLSLLMVTLPSAVVFAQDVNAAIPQQSTTNVSSENSTGDTVASTTTTPSADPNVSQAATTQVSPVTPLPAPNPDNWPKIPNPTTSQSSDTATSPTNSASATTLGGSTGVSSPMSLSLIGGTPTTILAPGDTQQEKHLVPTIDQTTGTLVYKYPLDIPPGRNGMTPDLELEYNSQSVDSQSIYGLGWSDSIPYITRVNEHGSDQLYTETYPTFTSSISGELVQLTQTNPTGNPEEGTYAAKVETGDFITYTYTGGVWTATDKHGTVYTYGGTAASRQDDPGSSSDIYKWMLSNTTDTNSNYISYSYYKDAGQIYPDTIKYTGNGSTDGIFEIDFQRASRSDTIDSRATAFSNAPNYHISEIDVKVSGTWVRKYVLAYSANSSGAQYLLTSITESGQDSLGTVTTLPAETFQYNQSTSHGWTLDSSWSFPVDNSLVGTSAALASGATPSIGMNGAPGCVSTPADVNGDGLTDMVQSCSYYNWSTNLYSQQENVYLNTGSGWTLDSSWSFPNDAAYTSGTTTTGGPVKVALNSSNSGYYTSTLMDVNGDGLPDLVQSWRSVNGSGVWSQIENVYLNTGSGWTLDSSWSFPVDNSLVGTSAALASGATPDVGLNGTPGCDVVPMDVNGDGLTDLVQSCSYYNWSTNLYYQQENVYLNTGSGWALDSGWSFPADPAYASGTTSTGGAVVVALTSTNSGYNTVTPMDVNGDGLADLVQSWRSVSGGGTWYQTENVYLNTGNGWALDSSWSFPVDNALVGTSAALASGATPDVGLNGPGCTVTPVDANDDGLIDMDQSCSNLIPSTGLYSQQENMYLNTGSGWALDTSWSAPNDAYYTSGTTTTGGAVKTAFNSGNSGYYTSTPIDVNGDGLPDLVQSWRSESGGGTWYQTENVYLNTGPLPLLSEITVPSGGTTQITYKSVSVSGSNNLIPQKLSVVSAVTTTDPVSGTSGTDTYVYNNGSYYFNTPFDKKFAGFAMVQETDAAGNVTKTYYHTGTGTDTAHGEYADMESKIGNAYRIEQYDGSGNLYKVTINKWDDYTIGTDHDFVKLARTTVKTYDGGSSHKDTAVEYTYDNTTGNLIQTTNWGQVTANDDGTFTDTGSDESVESISYVSGSGYVVGLPYDDTVVDQSSAKVRETRTYYDGLSLGSVGAGNPTKVEKWVSGSTYVNTQKSYDPTYGIVDTSTDERGKVTTYTPDAYYLYPASVTDPLSHVTSYTYDYSTGKVAQTTDQNGFVYQTTYDGLGRVLAQKVPDLTTPTTLDTKTAYAYTDTSGAVAVHETDYLDGSTAIDMYRYYDGLNRLIQSRATDAAGSYNVEDTAYNSLGLVQKQSLPYTASGSSRSSPTATAALYTTYTYDPLQRIASQVDAAGTTSYAYDLWKTAITDPRGKEKDDYVDAYGNLIQVDEHNSGSTYSTYYTWNLNGDLLSITDALGNVRNFTYDGLGNRLTAEDLHASGDSTYGSWSYTYDTAGNLTQSVSPDSDTVNYTYDDINRPLTEDYTGTSGTEIAYTYDTCTDGIGKLCSVTMTSGADTDYTYDANGNTASEAKTINGSAYTTSYTYDRQGNQLIITYPDNSQVRYTYNTEGTIGKIERMESGGSFTDVVSSFGYAPTGEPTTIAYANGVTTTNTYDASDLYRLSGKTTVNGSSVDLQDAAYTYDPDGNITQIVDSSASDGAKTAAYVYDDLNRLTSATITGVPAGQTPYTQTFTYNAIGDITSGPAGSYSYNGNSGTNYANPHAVTSIGSATETYDNDGNQLTDGTLTNTWNYKDQLTETTNGTFTDDYLYDHDGNRVSASNGTTTTVYPNKYYSYDGTTETKDIYAGNELVATVTDNGSTVTPYYVHTDAIEGSNVITDATGTQAQLLDYYPYGQVRLNEQAGSFNEQKQYGGHYFDSDTALNYFGARYYNPSSGQFISEDPTFLSLGDEEVVKANSGIDTINVLSSPQLLNSYAYAGGNPLVNIDPNGKIAGIDDAAGFLVGGGVGAIVQGIGSLISGQRPTGAELTGAFVTGGIIGVGAVNTPETLGVSNAVSAAIITGGIGGFYGDLTKQGIDIANGTQKGGLDTGEAEFSSAFAAATGGVTEGVLPDANIDGLSSGTNSFNAIGEAMQTKLANGTISTVSVNTALKAAIGSQAADIYRTAFEAGADIIKEFLSKQ